MTDEKISALLSLAKTDRANFPPTELYNEGWMLRLVLDWFSRHPEVEHELKFLHDAIWYSEALLPSAFLARKRGDKLAESWTHADGVIGHFEIGKNGSGDLSLKDDARQLVVTEAKIFSKLSAGVTNARYFNQAARNVACMAEVVHRAGLSPSEFQKLGFYVVAPESRITEGNFSDHIGKESIREVVLRRVSEYADPNQNKWFDEWFLPTLEATDVRCMPWEELLVVIEEHDPAEATELREFYANCLKFNLPPAKR